MCIGVTKFLVICEVDISSSTTYAIFIDKIETILASTSEIIRNLVLPVASFITWTIHIIKRIFKILRQSSVKS